MSVVVVVVVAEALVVREHELVAEVVAGDNGCIKSFSQVDLVQPKRLLSEEQQMVGREALEPQTTGRLATLRVLEHRFSLNVLGVLLVHQLPQELEAQEDLVMSLSLAERQVQAGMTPLMEYKE